MKRAAFRLAMPSRPITSTFGKGKSYVITRQLTDAQADRIFKPDGQIALQRSFTYSFGDGWQARVDARLLKPGESRPTSDGFAGYEWMVDDIIDHGRIRDWQERKQEPEPA